MKYTAFFAILLTLSFIPKALACSSSGSGCKEVKTRTRHVLTNLEKANTEGLGSAKVSCLSGDNPLVKIAKCSEVAKDLSEDKCLEQHKFTSTFGKPEEECKKPDGSLPLFEVVELNPGYFVVRQNKCSSVEAPFMYLMVGENGAFLHDTGAHDESGVGEVGTELRRLVEEILAKKSLEVGHPINLTVGHGHSHGDHMAGDAAFTEPAKLTSGGTINVVGSSPSDVAKAFNIPNWSEDQRPDEKSIGSIDLGGRKLSVIAMPGHESSSIAFYDHSTGDLFTGDSLYPGNVFTNGSWDEHKRSTARLTNFLDNLPTDAKPVRMILGSHVEHSESSEGKPGKDLGWGNPNQPNEHSIVLRRSHLNEMHSYMQDPSNSGKGKVFSDFSVRP